MLPSDEIWLCDLDSGTWYVGKNAVCVSVTLTLRMFVSSFYVIVTNWFWCDREWRRIAGEAPPVGFCGSYVNGKLYVFAGSDPVGYASEVTFDTRAAQQHSPSQGISQIFYVTPPFPSS